MPTVPSQIEMLNIFVGFEQTNKYAIGELPPSHELPFID